MRGSKQAVVHGMECQRRVQPQPLQYRAARRRIARSPGKRAGCLEQDERRTVETQAPLGDCAQEAGTALVESVSWIEGGDPDTGVQRQHGSA